MCNVLVALPTHLADTGDRLRWVHASMALAKRFIHTLSPAASTAFSMLLGAPAIKGQMLGLSAHLPPPSTWWCRTSRARASARSIGRCA